MNFTSHKPVVYLAIVLLVLLGALFLSQLSLFSTLELKSIDWRFDMRGPLAIEDSSIVILAIDDQSDESTPARWPWPRSYFAHVVENLNKAGAAVIAIDVIFDQADRFGPAQDSAFIQVLKENPNVVLTGKLLRSTGRLNYQSLIPPYQPFAQNARWGLAALEADEDGFYRKYPVFQEYNDSLYPSLAAQVIRLYERKEGTYPLRMSSSYYQLGDHRIPRFDWKGMLINFLGPARTFPYYSFDNVLDDSAFDLREEFDMDVFDDPGDSVLGIPPGLLYSGVFKDKIVLIGSTLQELHDNFPTPFLEYRNARGEWGKAEMPGVEIHANAIYTILHDQYLDYLPLWLEILILLLMVILAWLVSRWLAVGWSLAVIILLMAGYVALVFYLFVHNNLVLSFILPVNVLLLSWLGFTVYHFVLTQQEKRMLRGAFAHYVPESVIAELLAHPEKLTLRGEERVATVLFSDVAGFTSISEQLSPRELVTLLNEYLTEMVEVIHAHKGTIDKFEGDAIMAEFGVPVFYPEHAEMACLAALNMQQRLKKLRLKWKQEGRPQLEARIGINSGEMIVGNMGSKDMFDYTVMGDSVNLGARLESANKIYGTHIMISEFTYQLVKDKFITRSLDLIRVKGKQQPINVYELIATKDTPFTKEFWDFLEHFEKGVQAYRERQWVQAIDYFDYCLRRYPDDKPTKVYRERCVDFRLTPPPEDWDGVYTLQQK